jgi:hypothetical protein
VIGESDGIHSSPITVPPASFETLIDGLWILRSSDVDCHSSLALGLAAVLCIQQPAPTMQ